jgi:hypothetical protein
VLQNIKTLYMFVFYLPCCSPFFFFFVCSLLGAWSEDVEDEGHLVAEPDGVGGVVAQPIARVRVDEHAVLAASRHEPRHQLRELLGRAQIHLKHARWVRTCTHIVCTKINDYYDVKMRVIDDCQVKAGAVPMGVVCSL